MRILFLYAQDATFVRFDRDILQRRAEVTPLLCTPDVALSQIGRLLLHHDLAFIWFGLGHATRAVIAGVLLGRPTLLVGGGWDVAEMPEIEYGAASGTYGRTRAAWTFGLASRVLAFSRWSAQQVMHISPHARVEPVYLGVKTDEWTPAAVKEPIVLSIANVSKSNLRRKGLETFARASGLVPEARFILAGRQEREVALQLKALGGPNLELTGELDDATLRDLAGRSRVYVQTSYTEGFGLAVAEAMSAGCVPVVTKLAALPEVVGDTGFYVPYSDHVATAYAIRGALVSDRGARARARAQERFAIRLRESSLWRIIESTVSTSG